MAHSMRKPLHLAGKPLYFPGSACGNHSGITSWLAKMIVVPRCGMEDLLHGVGHLSWLLSIWPWEDASVWRSCAFAGHVAWRSLLKCNVCWNNTQRQNKTGCHHKKLVSVQIQISSKKCGQMPRQGENTRHQKLRQTKRLGKGNSEAR